MTVTETESSSFRDPSGFVFYHEKICYRQINPAYKETYNYLIDSGLYKKLANEELLIPHETKDDSHLQSLNNFLTIQPKSIPFVSYPYEWCFTQLKHAAQEEAIEQLQNDFELQGNALMNIQSKSQEIQNEMNRYLDIFKRHNLSKLAAAKPGLIEPKANKATKEVFRGIEEDSRHIDDLDDNVVELQPLP